MTRDDIIRMAREEGVAVNSVTLRAVCEVEDLAHFFKRAYEDGAAAERNRMIADGWRQCAQGQKVTQFCGMVEQEREACARVCEAEGARVDASWASCAAAIRARGQA